MGGTQAAPVGVAVVARSQCQTAVSASRERKVEGETASIVHMLLMYSHFACQVTSRGASWPKTRWEEPDGSFDSAPKVVLQAVVHKSVAMGDGRSESFHDFRSTIP